MDEITIDFDELMDMYYNLDNRNELRHIKPDITNFGFNVTRIRIYGISGLFLSSIYKTEDHPGKLTLQEIESLGLSNFRGEKCTLTFKGDNAILIQNVKAKYDSNKNSTKDLMGNIALGCVALAGLIALRKYGRKFIHV